MGIDEGSKSAGSRQMTPIQSYDPGDEDRPKCAGCGEPVELAYPDDLQSWIHAVDANYFGDHSAWLEEELGYPAATRAAWKVSAGSVCSSFQITFIGRSPECLTYAHGPA